jgi:outer membrane lipoprotein SlyB
MKPTLLVTALLLATTTLLGACVTGVPQQTQAEQPYPARYQSNISRMGVIETIEVIPANRATSGGGMVVGGLVGGILGNQVGGGNGKTAATVIGAVGGAVVGNNVEQNRNAQTPDQYSIYVHLNNGERVRVTQDRIADLRVGDRVRLTEGHVYRN